MMRKRELKTRKLTRELTTRELTIKRPGAAQTTKSSKFQGVLMMSFTLSHEHHVPFSGHAQLTKIHQGGYTVMDMVEVLPNVSSLKKKNIDFAKHHQC